MTGKNVSGSGFPLPLMGFLAMVCIASWLATEAAETNSVVLDEFAHVPAGVSHLDLGDFRLYRESPPFIRMMIALPVWASDAKRDYSHLSVKRRSEWAVGQDFINANHDAFRLYCKSRRVVLFFSIACAALIYWWANVLYDGFTAFVCASMWLMHPSIIAHSSIATLDAGTGFICLLSVYLFWKFLLKPTWLLVALAGLALGLAQASKFSMVILYPAFLLSAIYERWRMHRSEFSGRLPMVHFWIRFSSIIFASLIVLNGLYGFDRCFKSLGQFNFRSRALSGQVTAHLDEIPSGNRFKESFASLLPVPLPSDYLLGLDSQKWEEEIGFYHLTNGRLVHGGRWFSPFQTLMTKTPLGSLLLFVASLLWFLSGSASLAKSHLSLSVLFFFAIGLIAQTGMNWVFRYMIPIIPMAIILSGDFLWGLCRVTPPRVRGVVRGAIIIGVLCNCYVTISIKPNFFTFGNAIAGGIPGSQRIFLGSDYDWGQDLMRLRYWSSQHPEIYPLVLNYFGILEISHMGFQDIELSPSLLHPSGDEFHGSEEESKGDFYWAISSNILNGVPNWVQFTSGMQYYCTVDREKFLPTRSILNIGNTIYIFKIKNYKIVNKNDHEYENSSIIHSLRRLDSSDERNFMGVP